MEDHIRLKGCSRNVQPSGVSEKIRKETQSQNLHEKLKPEKLNLSYADFHYEITRNAKIMSPTQSTNDQKQCRKAVMDEELIKYMSKLPNYLERGESRHEKVLNVGVLDWGRLEKWQYSQKQTQQRSSRHSHSSSNSPSTFTVEGSSAYSSRGTSCSPAHQRSSRRSLQFHLMSSPAGSHSQVAKSFEENFEEFHHGQTAAMVEGGMVTRTDQTSYRNHQEIKLDKSARKAMGSSTNSPSRTLADGANCAAVKYMKANIKTRGDEFTWGKEKLPEEKAYITDQVASEKSGKVVLVLPRDLPESHYSKPQLSKSTATADQNSKESSTTSFPEIPLGVSRAVLASNIPHSCPLPSETPRHSETQRCSVDAGSINILPEPSQSAPHRIAKGISPTCAHGRICEPKELNVNPTNAELKEPFTRSKVATEKRSTSPFCRLSFSVNKISKSFSPKEVSSVPQSAAVHASARSGSENVVASSCQDNSICDRQNAVSRARSSPLRRLLDPLLKPKAPICHHSGKSMQRDFVTLDSACKSSDGQSNPGSVQPGVGKADMNGSHQEKRSRPSAFQALLRVAVKNGQPLFTFAVDNEPDILAATMKKLTTPTEDDYSCIYTFFAIQEVKKKNGRWMNQGNKGKGHDYVPNIVAQLKVSGSQFSSLTRKGYIEQSFAREFVLFAVNVQQSDQQTLDFEPNNELAAIVVKIPKVVHRSTVEDVHRTDTSSNLLYSRFDSALVEDVQNQPPVATQSLINATVILPSGAHSLPSKGGPSSLIQRWRSGGSCDCGGWDLGCKLRILANQKQHSTRLSSSKACSSVDKFEMISQGGDEEHRPAFSLCPFKDGIYSVEFDSLLSILQAFSICIAILDGKKLCEDDPESSTLQEGKSSLETALAHKDEIRVPTGTGGDVPARYVSFPPLSPVGRV